MIWGGSLERLFERRGIEDGGGGVVGCLCDGKVRMIGNNEVERM